MLRLRHIREGKGVSLRALAKGSGVAVATLTHLEAGGFDPRLSTLQRLAKALRVTVAALIGETQTRRGGHHGREGSRAKG
jgi:transcriptional regulator with XRE-family HTH domain